MKTKRKVVLHVGFAKTASTSIQDTLDHNRKLLQPFGVEFARFEFRGKNLNNHSLHINNVFSDCPEQHHIIVKNQLDAAALKKSAEVELKQQLDSHDNLIISGEEVPFMSVGELSKVKDYFDQKSIDLRVIAFVRRPLSFLESLAQQRVKSGYPIQIAYNNSPAKMVRKIQAVFSNAEFYSFEEACEHTYGPTGFFLDLCGIGNIEKFKIIKNNESIANGATRLIGHMNFVQPVIKIHRLNSPRQEGDTVIFQSIPGDRFELVSHEVRQDVLKEENRWLSANLGSEFTDRKPAAQVAKSNWNEASFRMLRDALTRCNSYLIPLAYSFFYNNPQMDAKTRALASNTFAGLKVDEHFQQHAVAFKEAAIKLEKSNTRDALRLMEMAWLGNKTDPQTSIKLRDYRK